MIKKFPEFIHKIKTTSLFFKIDVVPFEVIPIDCNALTPALDPILKTFVVLDFRYVIRAVFDFCVISSRLLKGCVPRNSFLSRSNRKKSQGAKSGEFGGCGMVFVTYLVRNSRIMIALCDGTLSWSKIHKLFAQRSFLFRRIGSRKRLITPK